MVWGSIARMTSYVWRYHWCICYHQPGRSVVTSAIQCQTSFLVTSNSVALYTQSVCTWLACLQSTSVSYRKCTEHHEENQTKTRDCWNLVFKKNWHRFPRKTATTCILSSKTSNKSIKGRWKMVNLYVVTYKPAQLNFYVSVAGSNSGVCTNHLRRFTPTTPKSSISSAGTQAASLHSCSPMTLKSK